MKKILLTALLGVFACVSFTNANNYSFVGDNEEFEYTPGTITFTNSFTFDNSSVVSVEGTDCYINFGTDSSNYCSLYVGYGGSYEIEELSNGACDLQSGITYNVFSSDYLCSSVVITDGVSNGGGGSSSGGSSSSGILNSTGQAYLGNVMISIQSVVTEIIPYMVYLSLGILVVTLGFIAIKWLLNYASKKTTSIFRSKRR